MTDTLRGVLFIRNQWLLESILKEDNEYANIHLLIWFVVKAY